MVGPLVSEEGPQGVLVLHAADGAKFTAEHVAAGDFTPGTLLCRARQ